MKSGDSEIKRQRIEEIDNRTAELSKKTGETLARVNKISNDSEETLTKETSAKREDETDSKDEKNNLKGKDNEILV